MNSINNSLTADLDREIDIDQLIAESESELERIGSQTRLIGGDSNSYSYYTPLYRRVIKPSWHGRLTRKSSTQSEVYNSLYRSGR